MMPAIIKEIGGESLVSWTITLYEVGTIAIGAVSGLLAMRHGIQQPMTIASLVFAMGCAISAMSMNMPIMLIGRLLQGAGGGGLMALSFVAVGILFEKRLFGRAIAIISMLWGASAFLGPMIGAFFVEFATWRAGFWAFAMQALILAGWITFGQNVEADTGRSPPSGGVSRMPILRLTLLSLSVLFIASAGIEVSSATSLPLVALGVASLVVFLWLDQQRDDDRLLPRMPRGLRSFQASALLMILCFAMGNVALPIYGTLFMTAIHGTSVLVSGYVIAAPAIAWTCFAVLVSGSPEKHDAMFIAMGMLLVTIGILGLVWSVPNGPVWAIAGFGFLEGGGFGMAWAFLLRRLTSLSPEDEYERVSSAVPTVQTLGYAFGAAYAGILANGAGFADARNSDQFASVAHWTFLGCVPVALVGLLSMCLFVRTPKRASPR